MMLSFNTVNAQIKNAKTETVKISGNCGMCEKKIEKAGNADKAATVDWDKDTKMATITYDAKKTNTSEILKRIALAGYDSDEFLAPDAVYASLPGCCKYDRASKTMAKMEGCNMKDCNMKDCKMDHTKTDMDHAAHGEKKMDMDHADHDHMNMDKDKKMDMDHAGNAMKEMNMDNKQDAVMQSNPLAAVSESYFAIKNALVASDAKGAAAAANKLNENIAAVKMNALSEKGHTDWMTNLSALKENSSKVATGKSLDNQRKAFQQLSEKMYAVLKTNAVGTPVYLQHCPMYNGGANWLSKENAVKNPYYGSMMMTCGKTVETLN